MRTIVCFFWIAIVMAGMSAAQPRAGDLILTVADGQTSFVARMSPGQSGGPTTLAAGPQACHAHWVRMAEANRRVLIGEVDLGSSVSVGRLVHVAPDGSRTTLVTLPGHRPEGGAALDHDGQWVVATHIWGSFNPDAYLLGVTSGATVQTFATFFGHSFEGITIDRNPGQPEYAILARSHGGPPPNYGYGHLLQGDRRGRLTTLIAQTFYAEMLEMHPASGGYLSCTNRLVRVSGTGRVTTIAGFDYAGVGARIGQDDCVWVASRSLKQASVLKYDLANNAVVTLQPVLFTVNQWITGLEVYGSRRLVCNGTGRPGTRVTVTLQSRETGDGGQPYALACALARRPGVRFANGERLDLDVTDPLFMASAFGHLPGVFKNFQGRTDSRGDAVASIDLPAVLPPNLGLTVFVAGVVYDGAGIRTVTNTHWFVLS